MIRNRRHFGRNEPCPCGSGKKFKYCCHRGSQSMIELANGSQPPVSDQVPEKEPALKLYFDPATQSCRVVPDQEQVKTWDFAEGLLTMATTAVKRTASIQLSQALQQGAVRAQQDAALAQKIRTGR